MNINIFHRSRKEKELLLLIIQKLNEMGQELDNLTTEVSETKTVMQSAKTLIEGIAQALRDAGTDKTKLAELAAELDTSANDLAAAVAANTPGATEPTG